MLNDKYMFKNKWTDICRDMCENSSYEDLQAPYAVTVQNATILPQKAGDTPWGIGGCLDSNGNIVKESLLNGAFGGKYEYNKNDIKDLVDETVIFIPIIPNHWGHFLVDVVSRLWILFDDRYYSPETKILFCGWRWSEGKITGKCKEFFELCGVKEENLIMVDKPIKVREVLIPSTTFKFSEYYNSFYKVPIQKVISSIINSNYGEGKEKYKKIYFSRTQLKETKKREIGEDIIEKFFEENGYKILYPENLTLKEHIFYINNADFFAGLSGTTMHNMVFGRANSTVLILNRTAYPCDPQISFNRLFNEINSFFIDVYDKRTQKRPRNYGSGPFLIGVNENLLRYADDMKMDVNKSDLQGRNHLMKFYCLSLYYSFIRNKLIIKLYRSLRKKA